MLRIKICHLNGEEEQHVFYGDVSFVIGRNNTKVIEFNNDEKETDLNYEGHVAVKDVLFFFAV